MGLKKHLIWPLEIFIIAGSIVACAPDKMNARKGALAGCLAGGLAGHQVKGDRTRNSILGCLAGAAVGGAIGSYLDKKAEEMKAVLGDEVTIERRSETELLATFSDSIRFNSGSASLASSSYVTLDKLAQILRDNTSARLVVTGHTDNVGNHLFNQQLSEQRAETVARYLARATGIDPKLVALRGAGEMAPIDDNDTRSGRAKNRRVDILILPASEPVPPIRFTMSEDTEPRGRAAPVANTRMALNGRESSASVPLADASGHLERDAGTVGRESRARVEEVIEEKPHLYSPIRTVDDLLKA